jgi:hypothetical protein
MQQQHHQHHNTDKRRPQYDKMSRPDKASRPEDKSRSDNPPNSRLFIVCGKNITDDEFREAFQLYGTIEEVWVLKDRGIAYVKFAKTSEAALAMEAMNGRCIPPHPRPLKVMIANSRGQSGTRDVSEAERCRLFLVVPKTMTEEDLRRRFSEFGDVDYVSIVKDRATNESKGFAYVKYHRMSHASRAFEDCDRSFKPVFAEPKPSKVGPAYHEGGGGGTATGPGSGPGSTISGSSVSAYDMLSYMDSSASNPEGVCCLSVAASPTVNQDQIWKLFDIVPGLDYCELKHAGQRGGPPGKGLVGKNIFSVVYNNPQSSAYAKEKLHGFEYPPGQRMTIRFEDLADSPPGRHAPVGLPLSVPPQTPQFPNSKSGGYSLAPAAKPNLDLVRILSIEILVLERACLSCSCKHFEQKNLVKSLLISTLDKVIYYIGTFFTGLNKRCGRKTRFSRYTAKNSARIRFCK